MSEERDNARYLVQGQKQPPPADIPMLESVERMIRAAERMTESVNQLTIQIVRATESLRAMNDMNDQFHTLVESAEAELTEVLEKRRQ